MINPLSFFGGQILLGIKEHKAKAPQNVTVAILSVSSSRTHDTDESGQWIKRQVEKYGHIVVATRIVPDDRDIISDTINGLLTIDKIDKPHAILVTGGTGITPSDVTIEAIRPMFTKELTAFGAIFAYLSYEEIDSAALLSRATAGLVGQTVVFCIPGSIKACKLACTELILPELSHIVAHATAV